MKTPAPLGLPEPSERECERRASGRNLLGTSAFDVTLVDAATVKLEGVAALRSDLEDVGTPFDPFTGKSEAMDCNEDLPETDLTLKFNLQDVVSAMGQAGDSRRR